MLPLLTVAYRGTLPDTAVCLGIAFRITGGRRRVRVNIVSVTVTTVLVVAGVTLYSEMLLNGS